MVRTDKNCQLINPVIKSFTVGSVWNCRTLFFYHGYVLRKRDICRDDQFGCFQHNGRFITNGCLCKGIKETLKNQSFAHHLRYSQNLSSDKARNETSDKARNETSRYQLDRRVNSFLRLESERNTYYSRYPQFYHFVCSSAIFLQSGHVFGGRGRKQAVSRP